MFLTVINGFLLVGGMVRVLFWNLLTSIYFTFDEQSKLGTKIEDPYDSRQGWFLPSRDIICAG